MPEPNVLYYGNNLDVLRRHVRDESVDLVYLDPPFNSNANYNVLFAEHDGTRAAAQIQAFGDTWEWNEESAAAYQETVEAGGEVAKALMAFRSLLGGSNMLAYLSMMAPRLVELRRVLRPAGSLYLHCDPTASHYLKLILDAIFGPRNFMNEVIWHHGLGAFAKAKGFPSKHDVLLFYSKTGDFKFNKLRGEVTRAMDAKYSHDDEHGRYMLSYGKKYYLKGGKPYDDVWDIPAIAPTSSERLGYPTQKPLALLERIISASSNPGDVVLDPFCGCGTAVDAAQALGRRWIGIDITHLAIGLIKHRLADRHGPEIAKTYRVIGEPTTVEDAAVLAREDPFQFQAWALGLVGARPAGETKKGGDKGIDGKLYFHDSLDVKTKQIVLSVKAGHLVPMYLRDLRGVIDREEAEIGVLISFEEPTSGMRSEAAGSGFYTSPWGKHPRLQLRTVGQLLDGQGIDYPHVTGANVTHRRASRARPGQPESLELFAPDARAAETPEPYDSN